MIVEQHFLCVKTNRPFFTPGKVYQGKKNDKYGNSYNVLSDNGSKFYLNGGGGTKIMAFDHVIAEFEQITDAEFEEVKDGNK